tara:strand:+ start:99 stop:2264 length:2166 start_codon:yes stop_codon:yes gene_type:complete
MPDLIYNVKFKIASKIDDLGGAGAAKSLTELNEAVDKTNRSTGKLGEEVKEIVARNTEFITSNNKVKSSIDNKRKATQNELRAIAKTNLEARARIKQIRQEKINLDKFIQSNKLNTAERTKLIGQSARLERQEKELIGVLQSGRAALQNQEGDILSLTTATQRLAEQKKELGKGLKSNNKAFSTANQTLFSLSDGLQDSAQFTQGFAQGMRAVGNNVGFTAELFGNLTTKSGGLKNAFKALGKSLAGPGGILIAINLVVTAATVLPQLLGKNKESAEDLEKSLEGLNDVARRTSEIIAQTGAFDLGIEGLKSQKQVLLDILESKQEANKLDKASLPILLEEAKIREKRLQDSNKFRIFFEGEIATQEQVKQAKQDILDIEQEIQRNEAEIKKTDEEILQLNKDIVKETEARRQAGLKLQEEGFIDAVKASINVEPEFVLLDNMDEIDALFKSIEAEQAARESVKVPIPVDILIEEDIEIDMPDLDLGPAAGTIAFAQRELKDLTEKFNNAITDAEAATFADRIQQLEEFIAKRKELLEGDTGSVDDDDGGIFSDDNLKMASQFTKGIVSLRKTELKSELQVAKARGASAEQLEAIRKKQFLVEKRSAIAETLINTAKAITASLGEPRKIAFAATLGAIQLAKIKATKFGGGGGGGGGGGAASGAGAAGQEAPQFTQSVSFLPSSPITNQAAPTVDVSIDRAGLAVAVNRGQQDLLNNSTSI